MTPRCPSCNLLHDPADEARCANARRLAMVLSLAGAQSKPCTQADHLRIKASEHAFLLGTRGWREFDDRHDVLLIGACRRCGGQLAIFVRTSDAKLAAAVESLKGDR